MSVEIDLTNCDREPIHVPGAIQPHGALIATDRDLVVRQASANLAAYLGVDVTAAVGQPLRALLGGEAETALGLALASNRFERLNPMALVGQGRALHGTAHRWGDGVVVEVEPASGSAADAVDDLRQTLVSISSSASLAELLQTIADEGRALTGFDRVVIYRFDEAGAGEVVAESRAADLEPYLGLHYPASDIPAQARRMYLVSWLRYIPDARYVPVPIVPERSPATGAPLDLTYAFLRSVSPIHLE